MKKTLIILVVLISAMVAAQTETYSLNAEKSTIHWKGYYLFKVSEHTGDVQFKSGRLITQSGNIKGGSFVIDMETISNDEYRESGIGPVKHLKDPDFFNVPKFPEATLEITKVAFFKNDNSHRIYANMTIKGITQPIKFMEYVDAVSKQMKAKFKIDRTRWGINYNNHLKDESISDAIEFDVLLQF